MYDICFICFNDIDTDARVLNILSFIECKFSNILLISLKKSNNLSEKIKQIEILIDNEQSLLSKWYSFNYQINNMKIKSKYFIACDFFSLPAASLSKKRCEGILIYDSREIYSALGSLQGKNLKQFILSKIESYFIKYVDKIIVTGQLDKEYLENYFKKKFDYYIIMNLPFLKNKENSNIIREKYKIPNSTKILLYQGIVLDGRGIIPLIEAVSEMNDIVLFVMGHGPEKLKFIEYSKELISSNKVIFADSIPYTELHNWTCSADIGTALFEPISISYNLALPNKLFEYIMAEIPIIATDLPAIRKVWTEYNFGLLVDDNLEISDIKSKINSILDNTNYSKFVENTKKLKQKYNYEKQFTILSEIFNVN